jgi:hypothetical protein
MRADGKRDFASLLDDLIAESLSEPEQPGRPTIPFDYLAVAEELHSGRIRVWPDVAAAGYREADATAAPRPAAPDAEEVEQPLPPIEPEAIWNELGLAESVGAEELGRKRRVFAFKNHPDRVAPHLRQRAMVRMQVANMLIDEVERRAKRRKR